MASDSIENASLFNSHFIKSFIRDNNNVPLMSPSPLCSSRHSLSSIVFPVSSVMKQFVKLKNSKSVSPDGFSSHAIKTLGHCLVHSLNICYLNICLFMNMYPLTGKSQLFLLFIKKVLCLI